MKGKTKKKNIALLAKLERIMLTEKSYPFYPKHPLKKGKNNKKK